MINAAQAALGISGIGNSISGQGRSGFEGINLKLDQIIEMQNKNSGGSAMPVEQPPAMPVGNLGGNLAQPDPVIPEIQNAGGGGLAPVGGLLGTAMAGGMDPIADASVNEPYQMPQSRSFI